MFEGFLSHVPTATQRLLDHLMDGELRAYVAQRRSNGKSWRQISLDIRDDTHVDVTHETLRNWYGDVDETRAAS